MALPDILLDDRRFDDIVAEARAVVRGDTNSRLELLANSLVEASAGIDGGALDGSWGTSMIDLSSYAHGGDSIRLRFDLSSDYCFGTGFGWYLDNVKVYACDRRGH